MLAGSMGLNAMHAVIPDQPDEPEESVAAEASAQEAAAEAGPATDGNRLYRSVGGVDLSHCVPQIPIHGSVSALLLALCFSVSWWLHTSFHRLLLPTSLS